jgi:DNA-binding CsgD family transcriptional regulator
MAYEKVTFKTLKPKRRETVREKLAAMWAKGASAAEVSKKLRISETSARTALGNLTRQNT